jgi:hypothetical protein
LLDVPDRGLAGRIVNRQLDTSGLGVIVSFQQIVTVAAGQAVGSPMPRLGM